MQPSDFVVRSSFEPLQRAWFSLQIVCVCGCVFANLGPFEYLASVDSHTDLWELTSLLSALAFASKNSNMPPPPPQKKKKKVHN